MKEKPYDCVERIDDITSGQIKAMQTMMGKCEHQLSAIQSTQKSLSYTEKELTQLQSDLNRTICERETLRVQVGELEMRMQNNVRQLVSELQVDMQNRVSLMAAEALHLKEQKMRELDESHTADLTALSDKHAVEIAAQLTAYKQDLTERDERAQCQVIAYKKRIEEIEDQLKELMLHNRTIKKQRKFLNERLRVMMQYHCDEALRLLNMHGHGSSTSINSQCSGSSLTTTVQNDILEESMSHILTNYNEATFQSEQAGDSDETTFQSVQTSDSETLRQLQPSTSQSSSSSLTLTIECLSEPEGDDQDEKDPDKLKDKESKIQTRNHPLIPSDSSPACPVSLLDRTSLLSLSVSDPVSSPSDGPHSLICGKPAPSLSCDNLQRSLSNLRQAATSLGRKRSLSNVDQQQPGSSDARKRSLSCEDIQRSSHVLHHSYTLISEEPSISSGFEDDKPGSLPSEERFSADEPNASACEERRDLSVGEDELDCSPTVDQEGRSHEVTLDVVMARFQVLQQQLEQLQEEQRHEKMMAEQLNQQQRDLKEKQERTDQLLSQVQPLSPGVVPPLEVVADQIAEDGDRVSISPEQAVVAVASQFNKLQSMLLELQQQQHVPPQQGAALEVEVTPQQQKQLSHRDMLSQLGDAKRQLRGAFQLKPQQRAEQQHREMPRMVESQGTMNVVPQPQQKVLSPPQKPEPSQQQPGRGFFVPPHRQQKQNLPPLQHAESEHRVQQLARDIPEPQRQQKRGLSSTDRMDSSQQPRRLVTQQMDPRQLQIMFQQQQRQHEKQQKQRQQQRQHEHWLEQQRLQNAQIEHNLARMYFAECKTLPLDMFQPKQQQQPKNPQMIPTKPWHMLPPKSEPALRAFPSRKTWQAPGHQPQLQFSQRVTSPEQTLQQDDSVTAFSIREAGDTNATVPDCTSNMTRGRNRRLNASGEGALNHTSQMTPYPVTAPKHTSTERYFEDVDCDMISERFWEHEEEQKDLHNYVRMLLLQPPGAPSGEAAVKQDTEPLMECQDVLQLSRILQDNSEPETAQQEQDESDQNRIAQLAELYRQVVSQKAQGGDVQTDEQDAELGQMLRFYIKDLQNLNRNLQSELKEVSDECMSAVQQHTESVRHYSGEHTPSEIPPPTRGVHTSDPTLTTYEPRQHGSPVASNLSALSFNSRQPINVKRNNSQQSISSQDKHLGIPEVFERLHKTQRSTNLYSTKDQQDACAYKLATLSKMCWKY